MKTADKLQQFHDKTMIHSIEFICIQYCIYIHHRPIISRGFAITITIKCIRGRISELDSIGMSGREELNSGSTDGVRGLQGKSMLILYLSTLGIVGRYCK